jgi:hypothetical protein
MPEVMAAEETKTHLVPIEYEPARPSSAPHGSPSFEMLFLGFLLGVLVALFLGSLPLAPALGVASAIVFGAADL